MKRYLDIENNIISFIENYNRNYCTVRSGHYRQNHLDHYHRLHHSNARPKKSSSANSIRSGRNCKRQSIVGSSNSINSHVGGEVEHYFLGPNLRKLKSESDLLSILRSKNYRYYTDEVMFAYDHNRDENDDEDCHSTVHDTEYLLLFFVLAKPILVL